MTLLRDFTSLSEQAVRDVLLEASQIADISRDIDGGMLYTHFNNTKTALRNVSSLRVNELSLKDRSGGFRFEVQH